jgi:hypothetical protein
MRQYETEDICPNKNYDAYDYGYGRLLGESYDDYMEKHDYYMDKYMFLKYLKDDSVFPIERASEAKSDEYVVPWQTGTLCTITKCKALATRTQVHEDYTAIWQDWLKKQKDEMVCAEDIVRHPFQPTANLPTVEFLKNPDNFKLLRDFLFHDGSGRFSGAILVNVNYPGGPLEGLPFFEEEGEKSERVVEDAIMKYIYGRYHFETIRFCFDLEGFDLEDYYGDIIRRELGLLKAYYTWYDDYFDKKICIPRVIKLYNYVNYKDEKCQKHLHEKPLAPLCFSMKIKADEIQQLRPTDVLFWRPPGLKP